MASSSDWIAQASEAGRAQPGWLAALGANEGFSPVSPFGGADPASAPQPEPQPEPLSGAEAADPTEELIAQAYAKGEAAGRAQAEAEAQAELAAQRALRVAFRNLDQAALDALAADLSDTVMALCTQVIAEHAVDHAKLAERCQEAAKRMGEAAGQCTLKLHPDDLKLIDPSQLDGLDIQPDPALQRGGLVLEGADGAVRDGPAEWRRAIAAALQA